MGRLHILHSDPTVLPKLIFVSNKAVKSHCSPYLLDWAHKEPGRLFGNNGDHYRVTRNIWECIDTVVNSVNNHSTCVNSSRQSEPNCTQSEPNCTQSTDSELIYKVGMKRPGLTSVKTGIGNKKFKVSETEGDNYEDMD